MRSLVLALGAALAFFAAAAFVASCIAQRLRLRPASARGDPERVARRALGLRLLPLSAGLTAALGLALPAFVLFEPRGTAERPGVVLVLLALAAAAWLGVGALRAARALVATGRLARRFLREGVPLEHPASPVPVHRIRHPFPLVALIGIIRPRLFIAEQVLTALSPRELSAVLAHEAWHVRRRDNLKRILVEACPAFPRGSAARRLERLWEEATEEACDARASDPLDLASALLHVARLAAPGTRVELAAATFHRGGPLARRVLRLLESTEPAAPLPRVARARGAIVAAAGLLLAPAAWIAVHHAIELLVHLP